MAAPYCTRLLVEAGARVIKVERPDGDFARHYDTIVNGESAYFVWLNNGKESLLLDAKDADDKQLLRSILEKADVFIQNLRPGAVSVEDHAGLPPRASPRGVALGACCMLPLALFVVSRG